jgi:hypothetical protein
MLLFRLFKGHHPKAGSIEFIGAHINQFTTLSPQI